ncbi:MAG: DUF934 domain-containing protein [Emcibacteraceae bacterium]|nr:DUF934 domain-containing protein [Emcibacteraceae bacterium]
MINLKIIDLLPADALKSENTNLLENISPKILSAPKIILNFPTFMDGRAFSQARRLKRAGFKGDLIASGDIGADQARQYALVGFSSLHFDRPHDPKVIKNNLMQYPVSYQKFNADSKVIYENRLNKKTAQLLSGGGSFSG